jgi:hypothetical protein
MDNRELFGRVWRVTIGPPGQTGRSWDDMRIRFRIHKTGDSTPNKLDLAIFNLAKDSRHYIENGGKKYAVRVEAGYKGDMPLLFTGRLELADSDNRSRHASSHQGADWTTSVEGRDGVREYRATVLSKSFGPKTSEETILHEIANAMGVDVGKLPKGLSKNQYNHGRSLSGPATYELDALCRTRGLRWSIQDGVLQVLPIGEALDPTAFVISPATGLIGSPVRTERGVRLRSLLRGGINPGRLVKVEAEDLKGTYVAEDVVHQGDSHENDWYTDIEAIPLK